MRRAAAAAPRAISSLLPALLLAGCGTMDAYRARTALVGANEPDIIACMGVPSAKQYVSRGQSVLQWDYVQTGTDVDLEFGLYVVKLGRPGLCHAVMRFGQGTLLAVHFAGAPVTAANPDSVCGRLVHECLYHRERTSLPADFDNQAVLDSKPPAPVIVPIAP